MHEELKDKVEIARDYALIGGIVDRQGNHDQSLEYHKKALAMHEQINDSDGMARDYASIAILLGEVGHRDQAIESASKGLELLQELEEKTGYIILLLIQFKVLFRYYKGKLECQVRMI
jgi:tetratricopeptide (TPR) repeat protein